jgi:hypothetical protein
MQDAEVFNRQKFRDAFSLSGTRATELLAGFVGVGVLKEKTKNDRTVYAFNPTAAAKVGWTVGRTEREDCWRLRGADALRSLGGLPSTPGPG